MLSVCQILCCVFSLANDEFAIVSLHDQHGNRLRNKIIAQAIRFHPCRLKEGGNFIKYIIDLRAQFNERQPVCLTIWCNGL